MPKLLHNLAVFCFFSDWCKFHCAEWSLEEINWLDSQIQHC